MRTIDYILAKIFRNPKKYFKQEKDAKGYNLPIPTRAENKYFLLGIYKIFISLRAKLAFINKLRG